MLDKLSHPREVRRAIRLGKFAKPTNGIAVDYVQCNILILPARHANDFATFCERNARCCPVLAKSQPGDPHLPGLGEDLDILTDLSSYRVFRNGENTGDVADIEPLWRDDFVTFAFGCSFSFEEALARAGVNMRYLDRGDTAALYITDIDAEPADPFYGKVAVSMRPLRPADAIKAIQVTAQYPGVHGEPIHIGLPGCIGIHDLNSSIEKIGRTRVMPDELPVFWACGVTPQLALKNARLEISISHTPAYMLVTDVPLASLKQ